MKAGSIPALGPIATGARLLVDAQDAAYLEGDALPWQNALADLSSRIASEPDAGVRAVADAFVARHGVVLSGRGRLEALRNMVVDMVELGAATEAMMVPISQAADALGHAIAVTRTEATDMRNSLWQALPPAERDLHVAALAERLGGLGRRLADEVDAKERATLQEEYGRTAELLRKRRGQGAPGGVGTARQCADTKGGTVPDPASDDLT